MYTIYISYKGNLENVKTFSCSIHNISYIGRLACVFYDFCVY